MRRPPIHKTKPACDWASLAGPKRPGLTFHHDCTEWQLGLLQPFAPNGFKHSILCRPFGTKDR